MRMHIDYATLQTPNVHAREGQNPNTQVQPLRAQIIVEQRHQLRVGQLAHRLLVCGGVKADVRQRGTRSFQKRHNLVGGVGGG